MNRALHGGKYLGAFLNHGAVSLVGKPPNPIPPVPLPSLSPTLLLRKNRSLTFQLNLSSRHPAVLPQRFTLMATNAVFPENDTFASIRSDSPAADFVT